MLHRELTEKTYRHGSYHAFRINDPKPRHIHKASVRDRLVHRALYRILYPHFDRLFLFDSYSCRIHKGAHRAINRFRDFGRRASHNNTRTVWVLKADIRKFFASIHHDTLKGMLAPFIGDDDMLWILAQIIDSFHTEQSSGRGLPLGNLTSQLLVNIYLDALDQFVKRTMNVRWYIRYADDFVIMHEHREYLERYIPVITQFLNETLRLSLHPKKVCIKTLASGVDFLGWVHFPDHRVPRTATKRRMLRRLKKELSPATIASYIGLLSHGNAYRLSQELHARVSKGPSIQDTKGQKMKEQKGLNF